MMGWKRESRFSRKFGRKNPWGGHKRYALSARQALVVVGGIIATMVLCLTMLIVANLIPVKGVAVRGNQLYTADTIQEVSGIYAGGGYFDFEPSVVKEHLMTELPYLRNVKITRWPTGNVVITVEEETGFFYTQHNQNWYVMSQDTLRVLHISHNDREYRQLGAVYLGLPADVRLRVGEPLSFAYRTYQENEEESRREQEETKSAEDQYAYVLETLKIYQESELFPLTAGLDLSDPYDVYAVLDGKVKISFGTYDGLEEKIAKTAFNMALYESEGNELRNLLIDAKDASHIGIRDGTEAQYPSWATE